MDMEYNFPAKIGNKGLHLCPLITDKERSKGYQGIKQCPSNEEGLLFIFDDEKSRTFHMKNVHFDLDLLGFNEEGRLVFVLPMQANSNLKYKTLPCKYAVEVIKGWGRNLDIGLCKLTLYR